MTYFAKDCAAISDACAKDSSVIIGAGLLTLLSIRQPFYRVRGDFETVRKEGASATPLFGWKRQGFIDLVSKADWLKEQADSARGKTDAASLESLIIAYLSISGLGLAKASFLAQLTTQRGACLDGHNLKRLGLAEDAFKLPKKSLPRTILAKMQTYNAAWQESGDSAFWWDSWCDLIAAKYPTRFVSGAEVSRVHLVALEYQESN